MQCHFEALLMYRLQDVHHLLLPIFRHQGCWLTWPTIVASLLFCWQAACMIGVPWMMEEMDVNL
jgi:hypothetical protein